LLISNVWNEEGNLDSIFKQVSKQSIKPAQWLIINDGSTDNTFRELKELQSRDSNINTISIFSIPPKNKGNLDTLGIAVRKALKSITGKFDFYAKLDIDTVLPSDYFEKIFQEFDKDKKLMCASGTIYYKEKKESNRRKWARGSGLVIRGLFFDYYRNQIPEITLETWIGTLAQIHNYKTKEFPHIKEIQLKPTTQLTKKGVYRRGRLAYYFGFNLLSIIVRAVIAEFVTRKNGKLFLQGYLAAWRMAWKIDNESIRRYWFRNLIFLDLKSFFFRKK
jgi:cellulose synthase/poly-beta-1,6-N-acetylglucosamine synthase-like glycosyltransferase